MTKGHIPGGGLHSRNVRHSTAPKVEPKAYGRNPGAVAQYGNHPGNHVTSYGGSKTSYKGEPDTMKRGYQNPVGPTNMALSGPGAGREVMRSGGQGTHGQPAAGMPGLPSTRGQWPDSK
jgi:hypothetical protein